MPYSIVHWRQRWSYRKHPARRRDSERLLVILQIAFSGYLKPFLQTIGEQIDTVARSGRVVPLWNKVLSESA